MKINEQVRTMAYNSDYFEKRYTFERIYNLYSLRMVKSILHVLDPKKVLDVGCGRGYHVLAFRSLGVEAYGVDVSRYAIGSAPIMIQKYLEVADMNTDFLPFRDDSFDLVSMLDVLEHLANYRHALLEIKRVSRPRGLLLLTTPSGDIKRDPAHVSLKSKGKWNQIFESLCFFEGDKEKKLKRKMVIYHRLIAFNMLREPLDLARLVYGNVEDTIKKIIGIPSLVFLLRNDKIST